MSQDGPRAPAGLGEDDPAAVAERRSRAVEEPLDVVVLAREPFAILEVRNPLHRTAYRVMLPTLPDRSVALCTCPDFARRGLGTCKHIEAGGRWLARHPTAAPGNTLPEVDVGSVWEAVDHRLERPAEPGLPASLRWRVPGAALFEREAPPYIPQEERTEGKEKVRRGGRGRPTPSPSRGRP
jgi:hypothetical protein